MTSPQNDLQVMSLEGDMLNTLESYKDMLAEFTDAYPRVYIHSDSPEYAQAYYDALNSFYRGFNEIIQGFLLICQLKNVEIKKQSTNK